jgi:2-oxoglutarate ferredoxin oxidoreductase subunit beta
MATDYSKYLRMEKLPLYWCPGCGNGTVLKAMITAIDELGWKPEDIMMVSGIGCSSRATGYVDFHTIHTLHGRAVPVATAIKMAHPGMHVITFSGDGDSTAIGGNHFIHACRRNIDITVIIVDNWIYGMTGGQYSPLTPTGTKASTMPRGNIDPNFDIAELAKGAGATFVARESVAEPIKLKNAIKKGLQHKGASIIDALSNCHIQWGRRNKYGDPVKLVDLIKEKTVTKTKAAKMTEEELAGKYVTGILHEDTTKKEYTEAYKELVEKAQNE